MKKYWYELGHISFEEINGIQIGEKCIGWKKERCGTARFRPSHIRVILFLSFFSEIIQFAWI